MTAEQPEGGLPKPEGDLPKPETEGATSPPTGDPAPPGEAETTSAAEAEVTQPAAEQPAADEAAPPQPTVWRPPPVPQPGPWKPKAVELDPTSDAGWEKATKHELRAIRPEDVPILAAEDPEFAAAAVAVGALPATPDSAVESPEPASNLIQLPQAPAVALAPGERRWRRVARRAKGGLEASARPVLMLALFGLGVAVGWRAWVAMLPPVGASTPVATTGMAEGTTTDVPPQIQSLVAALRADDQTKVQTVVPSDPYRYLAGELATRGFKSVRGAEALWTYAKGSDSATEILISGAAADGNGFTINLIVHLHNGAITAFR